MTQTVTAGAQQAPERQPIRAALGAFVGTMIEWYDFYVYGTAAALVFGDVFFKSEDRFMGIIASLGTFAIGFVARPVGALLFGHFGDKVGRKNSLIITLLLMGGATVLIGLLPGYNSIGISAAILLIALRLIQGVAVGGEWGGAVLIAAEHAPPKWKTFLASARIKSAAIIWKEDVRRWHPNQEWIWQAGGFGVFDPGINALSIATKILPGELLLKSAWMEVPEGRASPLRAKLDMRVGSAPVTADFDFLQTGPQTWDIAIDTDAGTIVLAMGGSIVKLPDGTEQKAADREYPQLYDRFAALVASGRSDVDLRPLQLVADAFLVAERSVGEAFAF